MKKVFVIVLVLLLSLSISSSAFAQSKAKEIDVDITCTKDIVEVGETVTLTAVLAKHGSMYEVDWLGATDGGTVLDRAMGNYVSTATFVVDEPGIYTVKYEMKMKAGRSEGFFIGKAEYTIEVINSATVVGAEIREISIDEVLGSDGSILYYSAKGKVYTIWSDNTENLYGTIFFSFRPDELAKDINVKLYIDGEIYMYTVPVSRGIL